ncbi:MAG: response regulator transcription factor [Deltaproteobacteria bacterium]|nr:response regulator transcription factor [Deltaproteobacteria bacterium]
MRILVVEDEVKIARFVQRGLKEEGYTVDVAFDGQHGYEYATTETYDAIILDIMLPGIDGVTLCSKLREEKNDTPILMLTARDAVQDKVRGLDAGADDYLTKPFAFEEFLARIRALLRKKGENITSTLQVGDLVMDLLTHRVSRAGKSIELTAKEFIVLEYLMRNVGKVVTRTMLAEHGWDINFDSFTNVIDVYINYLRNKIDKPFKNKLIHTIRGRGYIIRE